MKLKVTTSEAGIIIEQNHDGLSYFYNPSYVITLDEARELLYELEKVILSVTEVNVGDRVRFKSERHRDKLLKVYFPAILTPLMEGYCERESVSTYHFNMGGTRIDVPIEVFPEYMEKIK